MQKVDELANQFGLDTRVVENVLHSSNEHELIPRLEFLAQLTDEQISHTAFASTTYHSKKQEE